MAQTINSVRDNGFIPDSDLYYEADDYKPGTSQQHDEETVDEFERLANMAVTLDPLVTVPRIPNVIPVQPVRRRTTIICWSRGN